MDEKQEKVAAKLLDAILEAQTPNDIATYVQAYQGFIGSVVQMAYLKRDTE